MKKIITILLGIMSVSCLWAQEPAANVAALTALKAQAKQDLAAFEQKFSKHKNLAPAILASIPLLRTQAIEYAGKIETALQQKRPIFPGNEAIASNAQQQEYFTKFAKYLRSPFFL